MRSFVAILTAAFIGLAFVPSEASARPFGGGFHGFHGGFHGGFRPGFRRFGPAVGVAAVDRAPPGRACASFPVFAPRFCGH